MRRWVIVVMAIALCLMPMPVEAANDEVVLMVNGEVAELDVPAQIIDGRTMVPVRFVSETLGAEVDWHSETSTVVIETVGFTGTSDPGLKGAGALPGIKVMVDGELVEFDVPPRIVGGRTMVPVRFVSQALGAEVQWDPATSTVLITLAEQGVYRSAELGFKVEYPSTWTVREVDGGIGISRVDDAMSIGIYTQCDDPFITPTLFAAQYIANLRKLGLSFEPHSTPAAHPWQVGSYDAHVSATYVDPDDNRSHYVDQIAFTARGRVVLVNVLYLSAPGGGEDTSLRASVIPEAAGILASFEVTSDGTSKTQVYTNQEYAFSIAFPASWVKYMDLGGRMLGFTNEAGTTLMLGFEAAPPGMTADDYLEAAKQGATGLLSEGAVDFGSTRPSVLGGYDGRVIDYTVTMMGIEMHGEQHVLLKDGTFYTVTFTILKEFESDPVIRQAIQGVLDSIVVGG